MANTNHKPGSPLCLTKQPHLSLFILLDDELVSAMQESLKNQYILTTTPKNTDLYKDSLKHLQYLREEVGTKVIWQFAEALGVQS